MVAAVQEEALRSQHALCWPTKVLFKQRSVQADAELACDRLGTNMGKLGFAPSTGLYSQALHASCQISCWVYK